MIRHQYLRPVIAVLAGLLSVLFVASWKKLPRAIWDFLKGDPIDLSGFSLPTRLIIWLGFGLLFVAVGTLLFSGAWRGQFPLISGISGATGRGILLPVALLPLTHFLIAVGWSFMLAGALHARRFFCFGLLLAFLITAAIWTGYNVSVLGPARMAVIGALLLAVPIFFVLRRKAKPRPMIEFVIMMVLVSGVYGYSQYVAVDLWRLSGIPLIATNTHAAIQALQLLATPLLIMGGLGIAEFAYRLAGSTVGLMDIRPQYRILAGALLLLFAWRLYGVVTGAVERYAHSSFAAEATAYAGSLGIPLCVGAAWWLVMRRNAHQALADDATPADQMVRSAKQASLPLALAYLGTSLVASAILLGHLLSGLLPGGLEVQRTQATVVFALRVADTDHFWTMVISVLAVVSALLLARRGHRLFALFLCVFGLTNLWSYLTASDLPLGFFDWSDRAYVDFWWVMIFAAFAAVWLRRDQLTSARIKGLMLLLLITTLLNYPGFIANPLSPFLGFAGIGFVAFGIVYGALTGGAWANGDSPEMPRISRVFIHLGYILFGVAIVVWSTIAHDLSSLDSIYDNASTLGFDSFGKSLLYAVFALALASPDHALARSRPATAPPDTERANRPGRHGDV